MAEILAGKVHQLNSGHGGIPKLRVSEFYVTKLGVIGDDHNDKIHHGGADRGLCLFSLESYLELQRNREIRVMDRLRQQNVSFKEREGDIPRPGDFGENITTAGLDYASVRIGDVFAVGEVKFEITVPRTPCMTVGEVFGKGWLAAVYDSDVRNGVFPSQKWGKSGFKARVLTEGLMRTGEPIERTESEGMPTFK